MADFHGRHCPQSNSIFRMVTMTWCPDCHKWQITQLHNERFAGERTERKYFAGHDAASDVLEYVFDSVNTFVRDFDQLSLF